MRRAISFFIKAVALSFVALAFSWTLEGGFHSYHYSRAQDEFALPPQKEQKPLESLTSFLPSASFLRGTNVLLLGMAGKPYPAPNLTDTIILASFEGDPLTLRLTSIPRDLLVSLGDTKKFGKINSLYELGLSFSPLEPQKFIARKIEEVTGFSIDYVAAIDVIGLEKIIDKFGGVDMEVIKDIADPFFPGRNYSYEPLFIKKGTHHFDGHEAVRVVRSRYSPRGDFDRIERQQKLLSAFKRSLSEQKSSAGSLLSLLQELSGHLLTTMSAKDLPIFMSALLLPSLTIEHQVLDNSPQGFLQEMHTKEGMYALIPKAGIDDYSEIQAFFASEKLNPKSK